MTIAMQLANATTAGQKAAVTRKMNQLAAVAEAQGKSRTMVLAGFKAAAARIKNGGKPGESKSTIARELCDATTPGLKAAVRRKINKAVAIGVANGKSAKMVIAGFKAQAMRLLLNESHDDLAINGGPLDKNNRRDEFAWLDK